MKIASRCIDCDDVITNPICPDCLTLQMKQMVGEYDPVLATQIDSIRIDGATSCISCGEGMGLCAHCFSKDIYLQVKEVNPIIAKEFLARFDFDLRKRITFF
ncbi:hypothetical protein HYV86_07620 [Candidatus Woesearchaeota archaeon]|nr:hypothetical protein [Candidatus Woesearchaeota archaeon]